MLRILLIYPGWTNEYGVFSHFAKRSSVWPPLNLAYLAASAEKRGDVAKIIDAEAENMSLSQVVAEAHNFRPDIVGITGSTPFFHIANDLAQRLKQLNPVTPVIIGGPHITILKEKAFTPFFDYAFIGEADESWPKFLDSHENKRDIRGIKGILFKEDDKIISTGMPDPIKNIDAIPFPARHLLKMNNYRIGTLRGRKNFATIMTTRGCPFKCIFCSTEVFGSNIRRRNIKSVIDEIKHIITDFNIRHFIFMDDTLTLDRCYISGICDMIVSEKLSITFEGSTRANLVDEELIAKMAKSGMIRISFGLESVDPQIRKIMRKEVPLESYATANRLTNKYHIETLNSVILGLPGETRETAQGTLNFLRNAREIHQSNFSIATPYPGTELYDIAKRGEHGVKLLTEDFSRYRRYGSAVISVNDLSADDLIKLQNDGFVAIYSAPWRIIPMLKKHGFIGGALMLLRLMRSLARKFVKK